MGDSERLFYYTRHALCIVPCTGSVSLDEFICALIRGNVNIECLGNNCVSASKYKLFTKQQSQITLQCHFSRACIHKWHTTHSEWT